MGEIMIGGMALSAVAAFLIEIGKKILMALLVYLVGSKLIKWLVKLYDKIVEKSKLDLSVASFLRNFIKIALKVLLVIIIADMVGVEMTSITAMIASAGLAVGLALQGSLSNFAGGVLLLILKPFSVGDYIVACGDEGTVTGMDIFYTRLRTGDNKMIVIPNGTLSNSNVVNVTKEPKRRLDLSVGIDYSEDIRRVKTVLLSVLERQEMILPEEDKSIFVSSFDASAITIGVRVWVATGDYWTVRAELMEKIKYAFDENQITIPFDQLDVNLNQK